MNIFFALIFSQPHAVAAVAPPFLPLRVDGTASCGGGRRRSFHATPSPVPITRMVGEVRAGLDERRSRSRKRRLSWERRRDRRRDVEPVRRDAQARGTGCHGIRQTRQRWEGREEASCRRSLPRDVDLDHHHLLRSLSTPSFPKRACTRARLTKRSVRAV